MKRSLTHTWQSSNEGMHIRFFRRFHDFLYRHCSAIVTIRNILRYRSIEEHRFLRHYAQVSSQRAYPHVSRYAVVI